MYLGSGTSARASSKSLVQRSIIEVVGNQEISPVGLRLEVHVHRSSLSGLCGREHDDVAQPRETLDEGGSASRAQVLRNLDAQAQVSSARGREPRVRGLP